MSQWQLGDFAIAKIGKTVFAKVKITKDNSGMFMDTKGLSGGESDEDVECLCYFVESCRHRSKFWLPASSLHMATRARPYYGRTEKSPNQAVSTISIKKRKVREDVVVEIGAVSNVNNANREHDLNVTYERRHLPARMSSNYENAFREFVRRGKEVILDELLQAVEEDFVSQDCLATVLDEDTSTEDKFEALLLNLTSLKEVDTYLHQCWRYNILCKEPDDEEATDQPSLAASPVKTEALTYHTGWCVVCGKNGTLRECSVCPASYHNACRSGWIVAILHRKNLPREIQLRLARTRSRLSTSNLDRQQTLCPGCIWGPKLGYGDVVWHKLGNCPWWPAKVLSPGNIPSCLVSRKHSPKQWPLLYYGALNYSWGDATRMCMFLPSHAEHTFGPEVTEAVLDACDDYIRIYLT